MVGWVARCDSARGTCWKCLAVVSCCEICVESYWCLEISEHLYESDSFYLAYERINQHSFSVFGNVSLGHCEKLSVQAHCASGFLTIRSGVPFVPLVTYDAVGPFPPTVVHRQQHGHFSSLPSSSSARRLSFSGCCLSSFPHIRSNCSCTENSLTGLSHDIQMTDAV